MPDFWRHSGFHLCDPSAGGACVPGDDLLRAWFARPEVAPVAESCTAERWLFAALQADPRRTVAETELAAIADADARDNYRTVLRFRDHLLGAGTLERAYRSLFVADDGTARNFADSGIPPLFADQLAHIIVRAMLDDCDDALMVRAAELFFREQRAHVADGTVLLADDETVTRLATLPAEERFGNLGRLLAQAQTGLAGVELDVLDLGNAQAYWARDERHDWAIAMNHGQPGLGALCRVIERWVGRFFGAQARVRPVREVESARLRWYVGLDGNATILLNDLYNGVAPQRRAAERIVAFMAMTFAESAPVFDQARGATVYLALAMDDQNRVRMKPQNLLVNLPLRPL